MTAGIIFSTLFGAGMLALLTAQPRGAPKPSVAARLAALRPEVDLEPPARKEPVFRTGLFEDVLRPGIESIGAAILSIAESVGLRTSQTERRLRLAGDRGGLGLFYGQKVLSAIIGLVFLPAAAAAGFLRTPVGFWIAAGVAGFVWPDLVLRSRAAEARRRLREDVVRLGETLTLAVSAGLGLEGALEQAARSPGRLFAEVQRLRGDAQLRGEPATSALLRLSEELGFPEVEPLASALQAAAAQGTPITQALRTHVRSLREQRRMELVEAGERSQIRMLLPVGLLILPAFFLLVLYPAAVQLLRVTG